MSKVGNVGEFDIENDDWNVYVERVKLYFTVNDVKDTLKVPTLLTLMGNKAYKKIRTLCALNGPETKSLGQLVQIMKEQGTNPKPIKIAARYTFGKRKQQPGESVSDFHLVLKEATTIWQYAERSFNVAISRRVVVEPEVCARRTTE